MINIQGKIPRAVFLAVSGGVDSVAIAHFLNRNHELVLVHMNHNEGNSDEAEALVRHMAKKMRCNMIVRKVNEQQPKGTSREEFWRNQRLDLFTSLDKDVITCHHLNDCVETWIWSSLNGEGKIIPYRNKNIIRPFRLTKKSDLTEYAKKHHLKWVDDASNKDLSLTRNFIRTELMPKVLVVNPGIEKVVLKKVKCDFALDK